MKQNNGVNEIQIISDDTFVQVMPITALMTEDGPFEMSELNIPDHKTIKKEEVTTSNEESTQTEKVKVKKKNNNFLLYLFGFLAIGSIVAIIIYLLYDKIF